MRMADEGVALESSFKDGVKNEVLRSLCQLVNTSELALEVSLPCCCPVPAEAGLIFCWSGSVLTALWEELLLFAVKA